MTASLMLTPLEEQQKKIFEEKNVNKGEKTKKIHSPIKRLHNLLTESA